MIPRRLLLLVPCGVIATACGAGSGTSGSPDASGFHAGEAGSGDSAAGGSGDSGGSIGLGDAGGSDGTGPSGGDGGVGGTGGVDGSVVDATPPALPTTTTMCPTLATGDQTITLNGTPMSWTLNVGSKAPSPTGPIVIYWHATGTTSSEAQVALGSGISAITALGGLVASADSTTSTGTNTGDGVWYTGDLNWADFIIACAIEQLNIDTTHIHAAGYSAGALQTGYMWYARSGYLASAIVYSGGVFGAPALQDPSNAPSIIGAHGAFGDGGCTSETATNCDFLAESTVSFEKAAVSAGASMVIDCNDQGPHGSYTRLTDLAPVAWPFFKAHPFGQGKPDPYATGLPTGFPSYCTIVQ